jgi:hypothetical protein
MIGRRLIRYVRGSALLEACWAWRTSDDRTLSSWSFKAATAHASTLRSRHRWRGVIGSLFFEAAALMPLLSPSRDRTISATRLLSAWGMRRAGSNLDGQAA